MINWAKWDEGWWWRIQLQVFPSIFLIETEIYDVTAECAGI